MLSYIRRLHTRLGHPTGVVMSQMLKDSGAPEDVTRCAAEYTCEVCLRRKPPASSAKVAIPVAKRFNDYVYMDIMYVTTNEDKEAVLSMVDAATRFLIARRVRSETSIDVIKAIERGWIRLFGAMGNIVLDEQSSFCSDDFKAWAERHGIHVNIIPAEAHHRLGPVERRHQVLREALHRYVETGEAEGIPTKLSEALCYVPMQINSLAYTRGYSPTKWVLGYQPMHQASLTHDRYIPTAHQDGSDDFAKNLERRAKAADCSFKADASSRIRRAAQRRYRNLHTPVVKGQVVYYWRAGGSKLETCKWRGPATVVQIEHYNNSDSPSCYWLVHGTSLIRCAPEHVRAQVNEEGSHMLDNLEEALQALRRVRARGTTQYIDVTEQQGHMGDTDSDPEMDVDPPEMDVGPPDHQPVQIQEPHGDRWW